MIRCGCYVRQSIDVNGDELAVGRQWAALVEICNARGWEPVKYPDNDRTAVGEKRNRPEFERLLKDMESGELQAVACWDLDRLYREPIDLERIIPLADKMGISLATVTGDVDLSTDNGRLFARIKGAVAKSETERRSARQKAKYRQLAEAGENMSQRRSFGRFEDASLHPVEAQELAQAYTLVLAGHSPISIVNDWNKRGIRTSLGNRWRQSSQLVRVLKNPRNAGLKSHNREVLGAGGFDPIVAVDVWQAVVDKLDESMGAPPNNTRKYLMSGIMRCGECRVDPPPLKPFWTSHAKPQLTYRCRNCFRTFQRMEVVDDHLERLVVERLSRPDAADLLINQRHPDLDAKRLEANVLRERLKSLAVDFADGELDKEQVKTATARIKVKLAAIDVVLEDANRARLFKGVVGQDAKLFPDLLLDRRRAIVDGLMTVTLLRRSLRRPFDPESLVIDWKGPDQVA